MFDHSYADRSCLPELIQDCGGGRLAFFSLGSVTVSDSLLRAFRICEAATFVDVFSNAWSAVRVMSPMFVTLKSNLDGFGLRLAGWLSRKRRQRSAPCEAAGLGGMALVRRLLAEARSTQFRSEGGGSCVAHPTRLKKASTCRSGEAPASTERPPPSSESHAQLLAAVWAQWRRSVLTTKATAEGKGVVGGENKSRNLPHVIATCRGDAG